MPAKELIAGMARSYTHVEEIRWFNPPVPSIIPQPDTTSLRGFSFRANRPNMSILCPFPEIH